MADGKRHLPLRAQRALKGKRVIDKREETGWVSSLLPARAAQAHRSRPPQRAKSPARWGRARTARVPSTPRPPFVNGIKIPKDANLIETRTGAIMLNPKIAHKGKNSKERYLLQKFVSFSEDEN